MYAKLWDNETRWTPVQHIHNEDKDWIEELRKRVLMNVMSPRPHMRWDPLDNLIFSQRIHCLLFFLREKKLKVKSQFVMPLRELLGQFRAHSSEVKICPRSTEATTMRIGRSLTSGIFRRSLLCSATVLQLLFHNFLVSLWGAEDNKSLRFSSVLVALHTFAVGSTTLASLLENVAPVWHDPATVPNACLPLGAPCHQCCMLPETKQHGH